MDSFELFNINISLLTYEWRYFIFKCVRNVFEKKNVFWRIFLLYLNYFNFYLFNGKLYPLKNTVLSHFHVLKLFSYLSVNCVSVGLVAFDKSLDMTVFACNADVNPWVWFLICLSSIGYHFYFPNKLVFVGKLWLSSDYI